VTWLLAGTIVAGLLCTVWPGGWPHRILGALFLLGLLTVLVGQRVVDERTWLASMATLTAVILTGFGLLMLLAHHHPRRVHRHIIYPGYGLVFAVIALCWQLAAQHPQYDLAAAIASVAAYIIGSLAILVYKRRHT
jgi:drug/metabolite transporter superfamily protein YnfA